MSEPEEIEPIQEFELQVRSAFQIQDPDQLFIDRLEKKLADRFTEIAQSNESRRSLRQDKYKLLISRLAWGLVAVVLIFALVWGIKTLIPRSEPGISSHPSPSPLMQPTPAEDGVPVDNLLTFMGMSVSWLSEAITSKNAAEVTRLAEWSKESIDGSSVAISPDWKILASGLSSGPIVLLDVINGQTLHTLTGHSDTVSSLAFSPDGTKLASASVESTRLWDVASGKEIKRMVGQQIGWFESGPPIITFSPDGKILAFGAIGGQVMLWDVAQNVELKALGDYGEHAMAATGLAFAPDGKTLAAGYAWGSIIVWDIASGQQLQTLTGHDLGFTNNSVAGVVYTHDGQNLISAARNMKIKFWDTANWNEIRTVSWTGESEAHSLVLSPDGDILAFSGSSAPLVLMNAATGEILSSFDSPTNSLGFSPDGSLLITAGVDGKIRLWGIAPPNAIQPGAILEQSGIEITPTIITALPPAPEDLGIEKISIPILFTGEGIQLGEWSPDGSYFYYSQQGVPGESSVDPDSVTLSFLDARTGETCEGVQETVKGFVPDSGTYSNGTSFDDRARWMYDNRLLYVSPDGELIAITPCSASMENWSALLPDRITSIFGRVKQDRSQFVLIGQQAYWLYTPSSRQSVMLGIPAPEEGMETTFSWSPGEGRLLSSRLEGSLWIFETIDPLTGKATLVYEVYSPQQVPDFSWASDRELFISDMCSRMALIDISRQPAVRIDLFPDLFGFDEPPMGSILACGVEDGIGGQDYHLSVATGLTPGGHYYLYHPESGEVGQFPLDPPPLVVFPSGDGGIIPSMDISTQNNIYQVILVDRGVDPYSLVVKGHPSIQNLWTFATIVPGAEKVLFSSTNGISLVELKSGATLNFWALDSKDQYADFYSLLSGDGKTVIGIASKLDSGQGDPEQDLYWLRLEP